MADIHKAVIGLTLVADVCNVANNAIADPARPDPPHPLPILHKDLISLLSLIYSDTNKLSIALNPASPTYSAALSPSTELVKHIKTLASNTASFDPAAHGGTLTQEVRRTVKTVLDAVRTLAIAHVSLTQAAQKGAGAAGEDYLVKTAAVHALIERARQGGLSASNRDAVRKVWDEHGETVADSIVEFADSIVEFAEAIDADPDADALDVDDGWAELGLDAGGGSLSPEQRNLAETLQPIYQRVLDLHGEVSRTLLAPDAPAPAPQLALDTLVMKAVPLTTAADELLSRIYCPPADAALPEARDEFVDALSDVAAAVDALWGKTEAPEEEEAKTGSRRWFQRQYAGVLEDVRKLSWSEKDSET